jgi:hypothetical protein
MEYLHCGMPEPAPKEGVPITLYAQAASTGTTIELGTVTTNGDTGQFRLVWAPPTEDLYTITGTFLGDDSYWGSYGNTNLSVGPAPAVNSTTTTTTTAAMTVAAMAAVVVGAVVIQKRPLRKKEETDQ